MSNVKIELQSDGLMELMKSEEVIQELTRLADEIIQRCSGEYDTDYYIGTSRANVSIRTHDKKTFFKNLHDNELLKALR